MNAAVYDNWASRTEPDAESVSFKAEMLEAFAYLPKISVLMVVSEPDEIWIKRSVSSVLGQIYPHLELCVCDNASTRPHVEESLAEFAASDGRVKTHHLKKPVSRAEAYNDALSLASGEFVVLLDAGDEFSIDALFSVVELLQSVEADIVYADEDSIDIAGQRSNPIFKPYWSPDLLLSMPYVGRPCVVRRELIEKVGKLKEGFEGFEEYDLMLRLSEAAGQINHLPGVLYHHRAYGEERDETDDDLNTIRRVARRTLERRARIEGYSGAAVGPDFVPGASWPVRGVPGQPTVSVVALVPEELAGSVRGLAEHSSYPVHEVLVTGPGDPAVSKELSDADSFAEMVNLAAGEATGEYLLFLRNYQRAASDAWIHDLLREAQRAEVGAVGGKVLNGDGSIRSAGSHPDLGKLTGEPPGLSARTAPFPFLPVIDHPFNPHALTLECMMVRRSTFEEADGFDESVPRAFFDLDLSFRLAEKGLLNVYTPDVSVFSAGIDLPLPNAEEIAYMWRRWWKVLVQELHYKESPLDAIHGPFQDELPLFLQVQSGSRVAK